MKTNPGSTQICVYGTLFETELVSISRLDLTRVSVCHVNRAYAA